MSEIIANVVQGTPEWFQHRCAIPTASMFGCILTPSGKPSDSQAPYMNQLLAEYRAGKPVDAWPGNKYSDIGKEREPESRALYELMTDNMVNEVGIVFKNEKRLVACSPDGLISDDGGLEMKNPKGSTLISYMLQDKLPTVYVPQVQGSLWVTEREWWDFLAYHPDVGHVLHRAYRDEQYITALAGAVNRFIERMLEKRHRLKKIHH